MSSVDRALPNSHWDARELESLVKRYRAHSARSVAPVQLRLTALGEVATRPAAGVTTRGPEEPYVNSTSTVP